MPKITDEQLESWFMYHAPRPPDLEAYTAIRAAGRDLAKTIIDNAPACADTTAAVRKVREACMTANAAIACEGK